MRITKLLGIMVVLGWVACQSPKDTTEKATPFSREMFGTWVLSDYVHALEKQHSPEKAAAMLKNWVEFTLIDEGINADSVRVFASYNNHEGQIFSMSKTGKNGQFLLKAVEGISSDSLALGYDEKEKQLILFSYKEQNKKTLFQKIDLPYSPKNAGIKARDLSAERPEIGDGIRALANALIVGEYKHPTEADLLVRFEASGKLVGWHDYEYYELMTDYIDAVDSCDYLMLFAHRYQVPQKILAIDLQTKPYRLFETVADKQSGILKKGKKIGELKDNIPSTQ